MGRVGEKIYQSAELVPKMLVSRGHQKAKPGQMRKKSGQNINICSSTCIWFSLLCVDSLVSMRRKALATLQLVPV